jgi:hypothetical protein
MNVLLTPSLPFLQIILALTASLIPVANAFVILLIVIAICALLLLLLASPAKWVYDLIRLLANDQERTTLCALLFRQIPRIHFVV